MREYQSESDTLHQPYYWRTNTQQLHWVYFQITIHLPAPTVNFNFEGKKKNPQASVPWNQFYFHKSPLNQVNHVLILSVDQRNNQRPLKNDQSGYTGPMVSWHPADLWLGWYYISWPKSWQYQEFDDLNHRQPGNQCIYKDETNVKASRKQNICYTMATYNHCKSFKEPSQAGFSCFLLQWPFQVVAVDLPTVATTVLESNTNSGTNSGTTSASRFHNNCCEQCTHTCREDGTRVAVWTIAEA